MIKVSVIVPIYNVEKYIKRCLQSLFEQTMTEDIEYLLVDDCSPDNSMKIVQEVLSQYPQRKPLTRIIRTPVNTGQAGVRRLGIIEAKGQYVIHCDSDDWVDKNLYEIMYKEAERTKADITVCDFVCEYSSGKKSSLFSSPISNNPRDLLINMHNQSFYCMMWCKMMRRDFVMRHQLFPIVGIDMWEDVCVSLPAYYYANKVVRAAGATYHYFINDMSLTANSTSEKSFQNRKDTIKFLESFFIDKKDGDYHLLISFWKLLAKSYLLQRKGFDPERWKKEYPETRTDILKIHTFSLVQRLLYAITSVTTIPVKLIMRIKNKKDDSKK